MAQASQVVTIPASVLCLPVLVATSLVALSLSLPACVIVWVEKGVQESDQIPTSCNPLHTKTYTETQPC